jgi:phage shock protein PspC (stress-responsive transcriptional regulator)
MEKRTGLYRSRTDTIIGGVAGGIAAALNIDSIIIRILFVLLVVFGASGVILYLILWIALPLEEEPNINVNQSNMENEKKTTGVRPESPHHNKEVWQKNRNDGGLIAGLVLIALGVIFLVIRFIPMVDFGDLWPIILVIVGIVLIRSSYSKTKND